MSATRTNTRPLMKRHAARKISAPAPHRQLSSGPVHAAAPSPPVLPPPPGAGPAPGQNPGSPAPFFRPDDLIAQNNFWAQWNGTFADLDRQLADMKTNTQFQRTQLKDQHTRNTSNIDWDAASRGLSASSIRDGDQAQEQTNYTRADQNLSDGLNNFDGYVQGVKTNFSTTVLPGFNSAMDAQAVSNAQDVPTTPPPPATSQHAAPSFKPVVKQGKFYHYYPAANGQPERWVYIRPATGTA